MSVPRYGKDADECDEGTTSCIGAAIVCNDETSPKRRGLDRVDASSVPLSASSKDSRRRNIRFPYGDSDCLEVDADAVVSPGLTGEWNDDSCEAEQRDVCEPPP